MSLMLEICCRDPVAFALPFFAVRCRKFCCFRPRCSCILVNCDPFAQPRDYMFILGTIGLSMFTNIAKYLGQLYHSLWRGKKGLPSGFRQISWQEAEAKVHQVAHRHLSASKRQPFECYIAKLIQGCIEIGYLNTFGESLSVYCDTRFLTKSYRGQ